MIMKIDTGSTSLIKIQSYKTPSITCQTIYTAVDKMLNANISSDLIFRGVFPILIIENGYRFCVDIGPVNKITKPYP